MKKFLVAIIFAFVSATSFAQLQLDKRPITFTCGQCIFKAVGSYERGKETYGAKFYTTYGNAEQALLVYNFLTKNKKKIEEKYDVILEINNSPIDYFGKKYYSYCMFSVYDRRLSKKRDLCLMNSQKTEGQTTKEETLSTMLDKLNQL